MSEETAEEQAGTEVIEFANGLMKERRLDPYRFVKDILNGFADVMDHIVAEGGAPAPVEPKEGEVTW